MALRKVGSPQNAKSDMHTLSRRLPSLRRRILEWGRRNARTFPWRETSDPYKVLMAELMLRRTRAEQVESVYRDFIDEFPTPSSLSRASAARVKEVVYPLGLHWRADSFQLVASELVAKYGGEVPDTRTGLRSLSGVGDYVAGAVLSVAKGRPAGIVDTNVVRVFTRYLGLSLKGEARRSKVIVELAERYARCRKPREANLGLLDFAALVCRAVRPLCEECPLRRSCAFVKAAGLLRGHRVVPPPP